MEMTGATLTICRLDPELESLLTAPVPMRILDHQLMVTGTLDVGVLRHAAIKAAAAAAAAAEELNAQDARLGDGDLGITVVGGYNEIAGEAELFTDLGQAFLLCAKAFQRASASSYGTLTATAFMAVAKTYERTYRSCMGRTRRIARRRARRHDRTWQGCARRQERFSICSMRYPGPSAELARRGAILTAARAQQRSKRWPCSAIGRAGWGGRARTRRPQSAWMTPACWPLCRLIEGL